MADRLSVISEEQSQVLGGDSEDAPAPVRESQVPSDAEFERRGFRCLFPFRLKGRGGAKTGKRRIKTRDIVSTWEAQDEALTDNGGNAKEPTVNNSTADVQASIAGTMDGVDDYLDAGIELYVQVNRGSNLPAMDQSGTSDPYCVVTAGSQREHTAIVKKSLNPVWNETFVFRAEEVKKSGGKLLFNVWDSDDWTFDDFIGKAELDLRSLNMDCSKVKSRNLYLTDPPRVDIPRNVGCIKITVFWASCVIKPSSSERLWDAMESSGPPTGEAVRVSSLCTPTGLHREIPMVVHSELGTLYEEPCIACIVLKVKKLQLIQPGESFPESLTAGGSMNGVRGLRNFISIGREKPKKHVWKAVQAFPKLKSVPLLSFATKPGAQLTEQPSGASEMSLSTAPSSLSENSLTDVSMGSVNGEEGGIGEGFSEQLDRFEESLAEAGEEETVDDVAGEAKLSRRDSEDTMCSVVAGKVQLESYMYYKGIFGGQVQQSSTIHSRADVVSWDDSCVFVSPFPLKDREVQIKLYVLQQQKSKPKLLLSWNLQLFKLLDGHKVWTAEGVAGIEGELLVEAAVVHSDVRADIYKVSTRQTSPQRRHSGETEVRNGSGFLLEDVLVTPATRSMANHIEDYRLTSVDEQDNAMLDVPIKK